MRLLLVTMMFAIVVPSSQAQIGISSLVTETHANKKGLAQGEFTITNGSISPVATVLEIKRLGHDDQGKVTLTPTTEGIRLSETSARIGPRSSHVFAFETNCVDCAFIVFTSNSDALQLAGLRVQLRLGHTIYVSAKKGESLRRKFTTETKIQ